MAKADTENFKMVKMARMFITGNTQFTAASAVLPAKFETNNPSTTQYTDVNIIISIVGIEYLIKQGRIDINEGDNRFEKIKIDPEEFKVLLFILSLFILISELNCSFFFSYKDISDSLNKNILLLISVTIYF